MSPTYEMMQGQIQQLKEAIELQARGIEITTEKVKAQHHLWKARQQLYAALAASARESGNKAIADGYIAMGRAYSVIDTAEREQTELHNGVAEKNLEMMRAQLEAIENPSPLVGVQLTNRRNRFTL